MNKINTIKPFSPTIKDIHSQNSNKDINRIDNVRTIKNDGKKIKTIINLMMVSTIILTIVLCVIIYLLYLSIFQADYTEMTIIYGVFTFLTSITIYSLIHNIKKNKKLITAIGLYNSKSSTNLYYSK